MNFHSSLFISLYCAIHEVKPAFVPVREGGALQNRGKFIVRNPASGDLEVEGTGEIFRFASLCAPELFDNHNFEKKDTMLSLAEFGRWPVTRTYTLKIKSMHIERGHINGWDSEQKDFIYDEEMFRSIDQTLHQAAKHNVRLIIPIINQDYGQEDTNWVGNFRDLIRHRKGLKDWNEAKSVDWWTDEECIDSMKKISTFLLNRVNHYTGVRIGDDPTILAFETGNEMNVKHSRPAPASWTLAIAEHIKRLAPRTLVMDGSFSRTDEVEHRHPEEAVLTSPFVDILSYHYYGTGDTRMVEYDADFARSRGKAFIVGEYGFLKSVEDITKFLKNCNKHKVSGSLVWSLRPHSQLGGFKTHSEDHGFFSYHVPGWGTAANARDGWDPQEEGAISTIRNQAFELTNSKPTRINLSQPKLFMHSDGESFGWRGAAWADSYELWVKASPGANFVLFREGLKDDVKEANLQFHFKDMFNQEDCDYLVVKMRGVTKDKRHGLFSKDFKLYPLERNP